MNKRKLFTAANAVIAVKPHVSHSVLCYVLYALGINTNDAYEVAQVASMLDVSDEDITYARNTFDKGQAVYQWINTEYKNQ